MGKEQTRLYKELKKQMFTEYMEKELTVTTKMVLAMRLQMVTGGIFPHLNDDPEATFEYSRIADSGKLSVLLEDLEDVPDDVSIIVWAQFRGEIDQITEALREAGYTAESYYGGSKDDVIDRFKNRETRFLVANPLKGGEGLNLQVSTLHYFYSNSFKADSRLQAEDRSHRIGQTNKVTYKDLICKGTVDEHVHEVLKRKGDLIDYFRSSSLEEFMKL
jgi:SNF2 family DNA or RNA helicase